MKEISLFKSIKYINKIYRKHTETNSEFVMWQDTTLGYKGTNSIYEKIWPCPNYGSADPPPSEVTIFT